MRQTDDIKGFVSSKEIGQAIKKRRLALGMSQEKLAEELNVSYQQVQRYENGSNKLNVENIQVVATILKVPLTHFFNQNTLLVSEPEPPYTGNEAQELQRLFKTIKKPPHRTLLIEVARLAAQQSS